MDAFTILIDEREKRPLLFPSNLVVWNQSTRPEDARPYTVKIQTKSARLLTGDYVLESAPTRGCVERKASLRELEGNLTTADGRRRFTDELVRLQSFSRPTLILEGNPLSDDGKLLKKHPACVRDIFIRDLMQHGIPWFLASTTTETQRRNLGAWVASYLIIASAPYRGMIS